MPKKVWTKELVDQASELRRSGRSIKEIARVLDKKPKSVDYILCAHGVSLRSLGLRDSKFGPMVWTKKRIARAIKLRIEGCTIQQIADDIGVTAGSVDGIFRKHGITLKSLGMKK